MKKGIEWLKKEIGTEMIQLEPNRKERWSDVKYQTLRSVAQKIDQLDEPEVLSQKWIEKHTWNNHYIGEPFVYVKDLQNLLIPKKELPVIPRYVAEWITNHREKFDLYPALRTLEHNTLVWGLIYEWYRTNTHKFVNAYLTGEYEVKEEQLYYALIKGHELLADHDALSFTYWNFNMSNGYLLHGNKFSKQVRFLTKMTKEDWNKLGINDSNADFVNVEN